MQLGDSGTDHLQRADIVIADHKLCEAAYAKIGLSVYESQICAYNPNETMGSCNVSY